MLHIRRYVTNPVPYLTYRRCARTIPRGEKLNCPVRVGQRMNLDLSQAYDRSIAMNANSKRIREGVFR